MHSCIYQGRVEHRRFTPVRHAFGYRVFMMYVDLDELPSLFRGRLLWSTDRPAPARFRRSDFPGDAREPLQETIRTLVHRATGARPQGPIRLLTNFRYFGYGFNPVSFFYCFAPDGDRLEAVVAHVTSTPWGETHSYVVTPDTSREQKGAGLVGSAAKQLHVSPFMPMDLIHEFQFGQPGAELRVALTDRRESRSVFAAGLALERREISSASLAAVLLRYPLMTARVVAGIYLQAMRLYLKRAPYHPHPELKPNTQESAQP